MGFELTSHEMDADVQKEEKIPNLGTRNETGQSRLKARVCTDLSVVRSTPVH